MRLPITSHFSPLTSHVATSEGELPLRLLSLDFDGTMVGPWVEGKAAVSEELVKCLAALRKRGALLAINTGRSLSLVDQGKELFTEAALLLAEIEAYILNERQVRAYREYGRLVGLIAQNDDEMDRIVEYLRLKCSRVA